MKNSVPDNAKLIDGGDTEITVRVGEDGVWVGFFAKDGSSALVNLDKLSATLPEGSVSRVALATWAADRRHQAAHLPA